MLDKRRRSPLSALISLLLNGGLIAGLGLGVLAHPQSPVPDAWNLLRPLDGADALTPLTKWKLKRADEGQACFAALRTLDVAYARLDDLEHETPGCGVRERVELTRVGGASLTPVETRCSTALRLAMWIQHGLDAAAQREFGQSIAQIHHASSFNCRKIRTPQGDGGRLSSHATASAIDITAVTLSDGLRLDLVDGWSALAERSFWRSARDAACRVFVTTLGPDFNALHAGHFHLQSTGYGTCR